LVAMFIFFLNWSDPGYSLINLPSSSSLLNTWPKGKMRGIRKMLLPRQRSTPGNKAGGYIYWQEEQVIMHTWWLRFIALILWEKEYEKASAEDRSCTFHSSVQYRRSLLCQRCWLPIGLGTQPQQGQYDFNMWDLQVQVLSQPWWEKTRSSWGISWFWA
jgi:hypothetical protein